MAKTKTKPKAKAKTPPVGTKKHEPAKAAVEKARPSGPVVRSLRSAIYKVGDLTRAKAFYGALLGREPYFDQPFYVGYDVDGDELGLDPDESRIPAGPGGAIAYWRVDDISASWEHALAHGGEPVEPPHNVGPDTDVALVQDPFGNYIGLIQVP